MEAPPYRRSIGFLVGVRNPTGATLDGATSRSEPAGGVRTRAVQISVLGLIRFRCRQAKGVYGVRHG
jgi:hypothetical protein